MGKRASPVKWLVIIEAGLLIALVVGIVWLKWPQSSRGGTGAYNTPPPESVQRLFEDRSPPLGESSPEDQQESPSVENVDAPVTPDEEPAVVTSESSDTPSEAADEPEPSHVDPAQESSDLEDEAEPEPEPESVDEPAGEPPLAPDLTRTMTAVRWDRPRDPDGDPVNRYLVEIYLNPEEKTPVLATEIGTTRYAKDAIKEALLSKGIEAQDVYISVRAGDDRGLWSPPSKSCRILIR